MIAEKNVSAFDRDALKSNRYVYTNPEKLSCRLSNQRLTDAVFSLINLTGKRVVDLGCGDGTYTFNLLNQKPTYVLGIDASKVAIRLAQKKAKRFKNIKFISLDIYNLSSVKDKKFDVAIVRGLLHHLYDAPRAIQAISKIAPTVIVVEPNGYNPILKLMEKFYSYHIQHEEKSYSPARLTSWFKKNNGKIIKSFYCGLVPFFCPDWMAKALKKLEPIMENIPLLRQTTCAVFVFKIHFKLNKAKPV